MSQPSVPPGLRPIAPKTHAMSQQPGRRGPPPIIPDPIPLKERVTLYFRTLKVDSPVVQDLVFLKTARERAPQGMVAVGYDSCDETEQVALSAAAKAKTNNQDHPWDWDAANIGRYIASGLTQREDLELAIVLTQEEIKGINSCDGLKLFPGNHPAQIQNMVAAGAYERLHENIAWFKQPAEANERARQLIQPFLNLVPTLPQLTNKDHEELAAKAAHIISAKRRQQNDSSKDVE